MHSSNLDKYKEENKSCADQNNTSSLSGKDNLLMIKQSDKLSQEVIVTSFVIDKNINSIILELNHKYDRKIIPITINQKNWSKFIESVKKALKRKGISTEHIEMIVDTLDNNYQIVLGIYYQNDDYNNKKEKNEEPHSYIEKDNEQKPDEDPISFTKWSIKLVEKYSNLQKEILNLIPELWEPVEFALSVRSVLRIKSITLPFAGIILGPPSSLKTATIELFRNTKDTQYTDNFSAKSFVSHNTSVAREKLQDVDLLPKIKNKLFLTPELSPTFSKRDDELNEILGIITRILDGHGYESDTGAHGHRGYNGEFMFVWIGAAVDIPRKVYKLLGTLGPKLYFFRIKIDKKNEQFYLNQLQNEDTKGDFKKKSEKIRLKLLDYLKWFDSKTSACDDNQEPLDNNALLCIIRLANLLAHLRGYVPVWETMDSQGSDYSYTFATIEDPNRAITQLRNLARGHAISQGRNQITMKDIPLLIKVVLSTASKERVILFDHLIENNGLLDSITISDHLIVSRKTALKTMTELVILQIVNRIELDSNNNNAFQIQLKDEFRWFLSDEFKKLRENFGKEYYNEYVSEKNEKKQSTDDRN